MAGLHSQPHLFFLLADDLGFAELNFERTTPSADVQTPLIDALAQEGLRLDRHYTFKFCSPSRSSLLSGRNAIHVNVNNFMPTNINYENPVSGYSGIPPAMTGWGTLMRKAGYETLFAGKWDAGMATAAHTPHGRGFETALGYFHHSNDYWTTTVAGSACPSNMTGHQWHAYTKPADFNETGQYLARDGYLGAGDDWIDARNTTLPDAESLCSGSDACQGFTFRDFDRSPPATSVLHVAFKATSAHFVPDEGTLPNDLWQDAGPAPVRLLNPQPQCSGVPFPANEDGCVYEDDLFAATVLGKVGAWRAGDRPLFAYWAFHTAHSPYQVPRQSYDALASVLPEERRVYAFHRLPPPSIRLPRPSSACHGLPHAFLTPCSPLLYAFHTPSTRLPHAFHTPSTRLPYACHCLPPPATTCHRLPLPATACHRLPPPSTACSTPFIRRPPQVPRDGDAHGRPRRRTERSAAADGHVGLDADCLLLGQRRADHSSREQLPATRRQALALRGWCARGCVCCGRLAASRAPRRCRRRPHRHRRLVRRRYSV